MVARLTFSTGWSSERTCVDLRSHEAGTLINPWSSDGVRFVVHAENGAMLQQARVERWGQSPLGLNAGFLTEIELPCPSPWVELIVTHRPPFRIVAFNAAGAAVATHAPFGTGAETTETIRLEGADITRVEVHAGGNEKLVHSVCYQSRKPSGPTGTGYDDHGHPHGPFVPVDGTIEVTGPGIGTVVVTGDGALCIQQICITPDPDTGQASGRDEMIEHIRQELARWHGEGEVLAPNSVYKMTVRTLVEPQALADIDNFPGNQAIEEHAYFRTEGPPGLTKLLPPEGVAQDNFDSGLDDLARYVARPIRRPCRRPARSRSSTARSTAPTTSAWSSTRTTSSRCTGWMAATSASTCTTTAISRCATRKARCWPCKARGERPRRPRFRTATRTGSR